MLKPLFYAGFNLDRAPLHRRDETWVSERLHHRDTRVLVVWRDRNLILPGDAPSAFALTGPHARGLLQIADEIVFLGSEGNTPWFAVDASQQEEPALSPIMGRAVFKDLRRVGPLMEHGEAALLAHARGLMYWHRQNKYCGRCGAPTSSRHGGALRVCGNPDCGLELFPGAHPAVIFLITRPGPEGGACLLARQEGWPKGMYSTLAGFVDIGETLEEAVAREAMEESGVRVTDISYRGSQPWPFPSSLMLGFRARAETVRFSLNDGELEDARWITRAGLARLDDEGLKLPRPDSIARALIEEWRSETS